jgi:hypothetical protein
MRGRLFLVALCFGLQCNVPVLARQPVDSIGRVFLSPEERVRVERGGPLSSTRAELAAPNKVDGVMIRSEGRSVIWIDGEPRLGPEPRPPARRTAP